ncbi:MAG: hypothetical protein ACOC56_05390 [Atribacterota bacterium]
MENTRINVFLNRGPNILKLIAFLVFFWILGFCLWIGRKLFSDRQSLYKEIDKYSVSSEEQEKTILLDSLKNNKLNKSFYNRNSDTFEKHSPEHSEKGFFNSIGLGKGPEPDYINQSIKIEK